ncbi:cationic amino acid transporter 3 isoform X3 [Vespa velutina]|uniref:cationic amino acid transporter 3 isoform X3 n=1 Tax=Vespa velutina TaxID=202808 RepID=UPI001FB35A2B|nr:cationic amino acid transporter 3 isoform X3 [Vespa velutina]
MAANRLWRTLSRKRIDDDQEGKGELARVLNIFDLTALGVGATLGLGVYVLAGSVAKETAGPAVCVSFLIAAIASGFAGMCYAEFASRVPKAGSAYVYSYVTVGEFIAFVIGWNLILEYVIGTASVARGLSNYIDALIGNVMGKTLQSVMPINISFLSEYPDFFAFGMVMLLALLLSMGVKESSFLNNVFTVINILTILIVIVAGSIKADPKNWFISIDDIPKNATNAGTGGFMPFGITGVMTGAAKCFYGFVGFDAVATTGEEAKKPQRNIPLAIVLSLIIILAAYFSISTVLTMMWPYYDQNADAPFPYVFQQIGWPIIQWIVNIGAIFALCTSLLGAMFPLPRVLYAMASDGIIFMWLSKVHSKTMTPILGTILSGLLAGIMALFFNLHQLIDMMSIGTLLAYTVVAISVLILRYQKEDDIMPEVTMNGYEFTAMNIFKQTFNLNNHKDPSHISSIVSKCSIASFTVVLFILIIISNYVEFDITDGNVIVFVIIIILAFILILNVASIGRQPVQQVELSFKVYNTVYNYKLLMYYINNESFFLFFTQVPFVPLIPCCSIFINLYLMLQLDMFTWIRFIVWMLIEF